MSGWGLGLVNGLAVVSTRGAVDCRGALQYPLGGAKHPGKGGKRRFMLRPERVGVEIKEMGSEALAEYAAIPIVYTVESVLRVEAIDKGLGGFRLVEEKVTPYRKDYDDADHGDENPLSWAGQFDVGSWGIFMAFEGVEPVGGATVAVGEAVMALLGDRRDVAVLCDLRVCPERHGLGIGSGLFQQAAGWARSK